MNPAKWLNDRTKKWARRLAVPVLAVALAASFATYECIKPAAASAAMATPAATPLDDNSVGPLLSLDKAMETLAARVTPAALDRPAPITTPIRSDVPCAGTILTMASP